MSLEYIDITPDRSIIPKIGRSGHSIPDAISELVDNAIDAELEDEQLIFILNMSDDKIEAIDNARGMDRKDIEKAMRLGHSEKINKLGEFGIGLKSACTNLGKKFTIISSKKGQKLEYVFILDTDKWLRKGKWEKHPLSVRPKEKEKHGTKIIIEKLNSNTKAIVNKIRDDLSKRYAPSIDRNRIKIKINGKFCEPYQPELIDASIKEFSVMVDNHKVWGWYGLLKEGSQKGFYGFTTYRNNRMITIYDKIGIGGAHPTKARIWGEIHIDHVPVTHTKMAFIKDSIEYINVENALTEKFKELVKEATKKTAKDKIDKPQIKADIDNWKKAIVDTINSEELAAFMPEETDDILCGLKPAVSVAG